MYRESIFRLYEALLKKKTNIISQTCALSQYQGERLSLCLVRQPFILCLEDNKKVASLTPSAWHLYEILGSKSGENQMYKCR